MIASGIRRACLALSLVLLTPPAAAQGNAPMPLRSTSTIGDLLAHPALAGLARRILPWDDRAYDAEMNLSEVGSLLPYHTCVEVGTVLNALNYLIAEVEGGKNIFYNIYTEAQRTADPTKQNTGLFFFRGRPGAPLAVIAPGGGFSYVGSLHEGFPYALEISGRGYHAFVLKYRVGQGARSATEDLAAALSFLARQAGGLGIDLANYSLWGSSAGARMVASIGSHGPAAFGGDALPKPATVVMAYTAHADISSDEPPTFVVVGQQDSIAPPAAMERRVHALRRAGTPVDFRTYQNLGHGFGTGVGTSAQGWIVDAMHFWERSMRGDLRPK